jgi:hypothetical protein
MRVYLLLHAFSLQHFVFRRAIFRRSVFYSKQLLPARQSVYGPVLLPRLKHPFA